MVNRRGRSNNGGGGGGGGDGDDNNNNNNNNNSNYISILLCAGPTATSPVTETAHERTGNSQIQTTNGVISWSLSPRHAASSGL